MQQVEEDDGAELVEVYGAELVEVYGAELVEVYGARGDNKIRQLKYTCIHNLPRPYNFLT